MTQIVFRVFGIPVLTIDTTRYELVTEDDTAAVGSGSAHNFERDVDPLSPTHHLEGWWEDKGRFGFNA